MANMAKDLFGAVKRAGLVLLGLVVFLGSWFVVGPGVVGVTFNKITGNTASHLQGVHFKIPFVVDVTKFDVKTQRDDIVAEGASNDLQAVTIETMLNYHLDYTRVNELYIKVGKEYKQKVVFPAVNESVKSAIALYPVEKIIVERHLLKENIEASLKERLAKYDIILETLNLVDIDFSPEFNKVVEEKQIEEQKIKTAEYKKRQAEQNKAAIILEAEGESRKQELLKSTVSEKGVQLQWIQKWDGKLPVYMLGDKTMMMLPKGDDKN